MSHSASNVTVQDAIEIYFNGLKKRDDQLLTQQELFRFARWFGQSRSMSDLMPYQIEEYGEHVGGAGVRLQSTERLQAIRKFLTFAKKQEFVGRNLAPHIRTRKRRVQTSAKGVTRELIKLTPDGHADLSAEVKKLKGERSPIAAQIRSAAADKDVRENAPLEAAREHLGRVESRIAEIEDTLKNAVVVDSSGVVGKAITVGASVVLREINSGKKTKYVVVSAREANPLEGKISDVSPVGSALIGKSKGQNVEVKTPRGAQQYHIESVIS